MDVKNDQQMFDVEFARKQFPYFELDNSAEWAFFDNAGGTFPCRFVTDKLAHFFRYNKVQCTYSEAFKIAEKAAIDKFPEYKEKILNDKEPSFSERHGGDSPELIIREYLLKYEDIDVLKFGVDYWYESKGQKFYYSHSYYRESIEVILNNACEVQDVIFQKGKVYLVH